MGKHMTRDARLNAVKLLLDYAIAEAQELRLAQLEEMLRNATRAVEHCLERRAPEKASDPTGGKVIRLVVGQGHPYKSGNGAKA